MVGTAAAKGLDLICYVDDACPTFVVGDAGRVRQILLNLLSNAVKFTTAGEVLLTVSAAPASADRLEVTIEVTDTGIGIDEEDLPGLFDSFSQLDATATRTHGGTGLGLAIGQRLARAMGGDVSVTSLAGQGSTFVATVMVGQVADTQREDGAEPADVVLTGLSVLVVDDSPDSLRILDLQLSHLGMRCTTSSRPADALRRVAEGLTYDVALLDMHLPEMNGLLLGAALRRTPGGAAAPIILLSSLGSRPLGTGSDVAAILARPIKGTALRKAICGALSRPHDAEDQARGVARWRP